MREIELTQGKVALVDDEDYERVSAYVWTAAKGEGDYWYAYRKDGTESIRLHRFILGIDDEREVDHIDRDALNCQRYNMREATRTQNARNRIVPQTEGGSGYRGVQSFRDRWRAHIQIAPGNRKHIGLYDTPEEAARAYDAMAREHHGEFAVLNFPDETL